MFNKKKARVLLGKMGLDAHDNGIRIISKWLLDDGYEVIYLGLYNTPERMVKTAEEEDVRLIGVSFLGGEHLFYTRRLMELLNQKNMSDIRVMVGGVIPPDDVKALKEMGVAGVFTPGTLRDEILAQIGVITGGS
ncbi:MAG: cobalamin-dependent protein [Bacillota bacterium]